MNREEYMSALKSALTGFEEELTQEIITDYEERFRIGAEKGRTEEDIIRELGSIGDLVRELSDMQEDSNKDKSRTEQNAAGQSDSGRSGSAYREKSFSESFDSLMRGIGRVVDSAMKDAGRAIENAMEQVEIHMEEAKKNRYYEDSTNYEGSERESATEPNVEQLYLGEAGCRKVLLEACIADVTIRPTKEEAPKAVCHYYSHKTAIVYPFYAYQEGDTFYVGVRKTEQNMEHRSGFFQFTVAPAIELELWLPAGVELLEAASLSGDMEFTELETDNMNLRTKSGDINVSKCAVQTCYMEAISGDLVLEKSKADKVTMNSKSGDCTVSKLESLSVTANTASGDIKVQGLSTQQAEFNAMSGDLELDDIQSECLKLSTASGDIEAKDCRGALLSAGTASGDMEVNADCREYQVKTQSGDIMLESRHDADITANTTSGNLRIHVFEAVAGYSMDTHTVSGDCTITGNVGQTAGAAEHRLTAKSISGDITVKFS